MVPLPVIQSGWVSIAVMPSCCLRPVAILWAAGARPARVDDLGAHLDVVIAALVAEPVSPAEVPTRAPAVAGLYAWWARPAVLPALAGPVGPPTAAPMTRCEGSCRQFTAVVTTVGSRRRQVVTVSAG